MSTQKNSSDRLRGKRIFVHKPGRLGYTTISIPERQLAELLRLAHLDINAVTTCARDVSWNLRRESGESWSATVVDAIFKRLRGQHIPALLAEAEARLAAEQTLAQQAAENNQAWAQTA